MFPASEGPDPALERYRAYLRLIAQMHLGQQLQSKLDASDLAQETLLRAYQARDEYRGSSEAELAAWLRTILVNTLRDAARRFNSGGRDVTLERPLEACGQRPEALPADEQSTPSEQARRAEQTQRLAEALAQLPEMERRAVELKHLEGWTVHAIGEQLGRSERGVAGLLRRGLKRLREALHP